MLNRESALYEKVERGSYGAVMLHNPFSKPISRPRPFHEVAVKRPCLLAIGVDRPTWIPRRHIDRVLCREHKASAGDQCSVYHPEEPCDILDVMQR